MWLILWWGERVVGQGEVQTRGGEIDIGVAAARLVAGHDLAEAQASAREEVDGHRPPTSTTVVICTRDRPEALARCLASLPQQTRPPEHVIVVDNGSMDDRTRQVASAAGVRYLREDRPGLDIARNTGALAVTTELAIYTDDDVVLHPRWLERMTAAFDEDVAAVTGLVLPGELATGAQLHFERYWGFGKGFARRDFDQDFFARDKREGAPVWEIGAGASMGFRTSVFHDIGLFDERLDVGAAGCSGDSEYWHRLLSHGLRCRYDPTIIAFHFHRRDEGALRKQLHDYMRGHAAALLVQYERTGNRGNLRRILLTMPRWFAGRAWRRVRGADEADRYVTDEFRGFLSGIRYYLRHYRRSAYANSPH